MKSKTLTINNKKVSYFDEGNGEVLLFLYGWVVCKHSFEPIGDLLKEKFRVVVPDLPGHGDSDELELNTLENYKSFIEEFLAKLNISKVNLIGASLGGTLAILFANSNQEMVRKIILQAPVVTWRQLPSFFSNPVLKILVKRLYKVDFLQKRYHAKFKEYLLESRLPRLKNNLGNERWAEVCNSVEQVLYAFDNKLSRRASTEFGVSALNYDLEKTVADLNKPTLLIWGSNDTTLDKEYGKALARKLPHASYIEIEGGSHDVLVEKHREIAKIIADYLKS